MVYDTLVITPPPDDAETQMGGTLALLTDRGQRILLVDLTTGEPTEFATPGVRAQQAAEAARIPGVERLTLAGQDRCLSDTLAVRLEVARLIRQHRPRWVYGIGDACVHPDHAAAVGLTRAAVFLARLGQWDRVPGGAALADQEPWAVDRLFFPHCKTEPPWADFAFAVDVSAVYERKRRALAAYAAIFQATGCSPSMRLRTSSMAACWASPMRKFSGAPRRCRWTSRRSSVRPSTAIQHRRSRIRPRCEPAWRGQQTQLPLRLPPATPAVTSIADTEPGGMAIG